MLRYIHKEGKPALAKMFYRAVDTQRCATSMPAQPLAPDYRPRNIDRTVRDNPLTSTDNRAGCTRESYTGW